MPPVLEGLCAFRTGIGFICLTLERILFDLVPRRFPALEDIGMRQRARQSVGHPIFDNDAKTGQYRPFWRFTQESAAIHYTDEDDDDTANVGKCLLKRISRKSPDERDFLRQYLKGSRDLFKQQILDADTQRASTLGSQR